MQTMELPISVCDKLDRLNRNYLWGDTDNKKRIHLINWNKVCTGKSFGGLGIRKARNSNLALLTKLGWKIINQEDNLWVSIITDKYLTNHSLSTWPNKRPASHVWRSIINARFVIGKGTKWKIGDGQNVDLWRDWWCGDGPLINSFPGNHGHADIKVQDINNIDGFWDLSYLSAFVDHPTLSLIVKMNVTGVSNAVDCPIWVGTPNGNGKFSVSTAYSRINNGEIAPVHWAWIWKLKIPAKLKTFLWIILNDSLPTNSLRTHRGMIPMSFCPRCDETPEDANHLFRLCSKPKDIWSCLRSNDWLNGSLSKSLLEWILYNAKSKSTFQLDTSVPWSTVLTVSLWQIRKD